MSKKNKHMTLDDRIEIQECLNKGITATVVTLEEFTMPKMHRRSTKPYWWNHGKEFR